MTATNKKLADRLQWHQLPEDGGQIVDVTYAVDETYLYCKRHDRSDNTTTIERATLTDTDENFEPWNNWLPNHGEWEATDEYTVSYRDDQCSETVEITAESIGDATEQAEQLTREWVEGGEWGHDGASISARYTVTDSTGEEVAADWVTVEIDPDRSAIMKDSIDGDSIENFCGYSDDAHDWTADVDIVGGLRENPGVFSKGGTALAIVRVCADCGIIRREYHCGSQRNPGEHDTVEYRMPEDDE